ncbi:insulin-like growth factor 1 receptor [Ptychodera flava]|uniref:insulin-like growth factor 1 receptor n=1 Tax=Ptychodera flava TaxID=63121 RepID=UPI00396A6AAB
MNTVATVTNLVTGDVEELRINGTESEHFRVTAYEWKYPKANNLMKQILSSGRLSKTYDDYASETMFVEFTVKGIDANIGLKLNVLLRQETNSQTNPLPFLTITSLRSKIIGCPHGTFGARCDRNCICKNDATCHAWNGACKCLPGWQGAACDIPEAPEVRLSVTSSAVPIHGAISLMCVYKNIMNTYRDVDLEHNGNLLNITSRGGTVTKPYNRMVTMVTIPNATYEDSGKYRCIAYGYDKDAYFKSNSLRIDVKGCLDNLWGDNCNKNCDCVHANKCTQSYGCQCIRGWTGANCDRDSLQPFIHNCPTIITRLVHRASDLTNVTWLPLRASDNGGIKSIQSTHESGQLFPVGDTMVVISVFDRWNNSNTCTFMVRVKATSNNSLDATVIASIAFGCVLFAVVSMVCACSIHSQISRPPRHKYSRINKVNWKKDMPVDVKIIPKSRLMIRDILGEGEFSKVHRARLVLRNGGTTMVALKVIKDEDEYWHQYVLEVQLLHKLQDNPNVVQLIGVIQDQRLSGIIIELMKSDLLGFLKNWENIRINVHNLNGHLLKFASDVARAIEYLYNKQVVHRDIAARNILISFDDVAKIADFGLSRDVYQKGQYHKHPKQGMLVPIRWMAPESLVTGVYSYKSDIWSYGVLLWEMATLGDTPYPEFQPLDSDFLTRQLCTGYRMPKPCHCTDDIYGMMRHCCKNDPEERPEAVGLVNNISRFEKSNKGFFEIDGP